MTTKDAKDFLVQQTAEQAALEGISLSDLEKRMMYFVENDPISCVDPLELNQEFEEKCDTEEYETKIASLLHRAYKRLKSEDSDKAPCEPCSGKCSEYEFFSALMSVDEFQQVEAGQFDAEEIDTHQ